MSDIPLLTAEEIEVRVQSISKNKSGKVGAVLLIYKDARVDMNILDKVYGPGNWQRTHEVINGNLFCNIDIWDAEKKCWVRKQDVGVESNTEKEKGQASDAFKRAGFNVGIGRELYTGPFIYVELRPDEYHEQGNSIKCWPSTKFTVAAIGYNEFREINALAIADTKGEIRFDMNRRSIISSSGGSKVGGKVNTPEPHGEHLCAGCGKKINQTVYDYSTKKYGKALCMACQKEA